MATYPYANAIFVIAAVGFCVVALLDHSGWRKWLGVCLFLLTMAACLLKYNRAFLPTQRFDFRLNSGLISAVQQVARVDEVLLIYGDDWSSAYPYYFHRRALMDRENRSVDDPKIQAALAIMKREGFRFGAVLACHPGFVTNPVFQENIKRLGFESTPVFPGPVCVVYGRQ
ncbi:MAG: hypothetical protein AABZ06_11690 [Bdellovibrionota bacterium]